MQISKRLEAVAAMVEPGSRLIDVGTDHGYIPIYLKSRGIIESALAMDINKGPLQRARENIMKSGFEADIKTRLSDGLSRAGKDPGDCVVIAGMGGPLTIKILTEGENVLKAVRTLVLQPQSEIAGVRYFLHDKGYRILNENMVLDEGKYYVIIKAVRGRECYERKCCYTYGCCLLRQRHPVLYAFLHRELKKYNEILKEIGDVSSRQAGERKAELKDKISEVLEALKVYGHSHMDQEDMI